VVPRRRVRVVLGCWSVLVIGGLGILTGSYDP
jgi:hypothetical protein